MIVSKLDIAKKVIRENTHEAMYGIFDCRNFLGDPMFNIYNEGGLVIDICYDYEYFEVFGLSDVDFSVLREYYDQLKEKFGERSLKVNDEF